MITKPSEPPIAAPAPRSVSTTKDPAYWQALGEFIETFASTETMLFSYLIVRIKVPHPVGRALFGGHHVDQLIGAVSRITLVLPPDHDLAEKTVLALDQLRIINATRNSIIHYPSFVTSDKGRISSNITRARRAELIIEYRATVEALKEMTADLERISQIFLYCFLIAQGTKSLTPSMTPSQLAAEMPALNAAWLYKQPQAP
ncbi:MAG: hypothetical protein ABR929_05610 [Roseiarcus sp.]